MQRQHLMKHIPIPANKIITTFITKKKNIMKLSLLLIITICALSACKNQQQKDAEKLMEQIQTTVKQNTPGLIATSENGYWMKAKIDGKEWKASGMLPNDNSDSRRIHGENNGEAISFSVWIRGLKAGKHFPFSEDDVADLFTNDDVGIWGGRKGEVIITKVDETSLEGSFSFTGSTNRSEKTVEITDGYFRMPLTSAAK